ncbi:MAG: hypothetical protein RMJ33_01400 [Saprospiraceae bacterium]|nr:hypothetical protein [Saprospiraceae bacterium]MDW8228466.1 hypothetical protein [Saprospiraceae bacterium]
MVGREPDRLTLHPQPIPGWFFLRQDFEYLASGLTLDWFAGTRWQVWGAASYYRSRSFHAQMLELQDDGKLQPRDLPIDRSFNLYDVGWSGELSIRYVFWSISTLQLTYQYRRQANRLGILSPEEQVAESLRLRAIVFLDLLPR